MKVVKGKKETNHYLFFESLNYEFFHTINNFVFE